jgi:hypothetical protein
VKINCSIRENKLFQHFDGCMYDNILERINEDTKILKYNYIFKKKVHGVGGQMNPTLDVT